jgi:glycosyltransferase involved in cell wall biosynthesis
MPNVLIYKSDLLHPSETFVAAQAHALRRFTPCFVGLRRIPTSLLIDPCETITLTQNDTLRDRLHRRFFLETGVAPDFLRALQRSQPVLIHAHFAVDGAAALPLQKQLRLPLIVTLHGYDATSTDAFQRTWAPGRVYLRRRADLRARTRFFVCVSEHIRQQAIERGVAPEKIRVIPIGVDLGFFAPDPLRSRDLDPIVLFVGRLVEKKGCTHLISAMEQVEARHPSAKLLIVGDGPLLDPLRAQAHAQLRRCTFLGSQPPSVVRDLMYRASVLAVPSIIAADGDTEGLPITLCEGQAIGLPVAAFDGPGVSEAVVANETALLVSQGDEGGLAEAISRILDDPDMRSRLARAGRLRAEENFSLEKQTARLEDLYCEALQ